MSNKAELQRIVNEIGYELGPFTSKDTLSNIIRLHSIVVTDKDINVAELNDLELRKRLIRHGLLVGPVTNHTRSIYQRKLLEILTNETSEGQEDEDDSLLLDEKNTLYPDLFSTKSNLNSSRKNGEPMIIRHDYKATSTSTRNTYGNSNEVRPRKEQQSVKINTDTTPKKVNNNNDKHQVATKSSGKFLYVGITIVVALIVFVLYLWLEK